MCAGLGMYCLLTAGLTGSAAAAPKGSAAYKATQMAAAPKPAETTTPAPAAQPAPAATPGVNPITQAAVKAGIFACTSRINEVMSYITANSTSGAYLFLPKKLPDQSIFSVSVEVQVKDVQPLYASATFAPLTSGQAGAVYDVVEYVPQSCDYMEKNIFKNLKRIGILKKDIRILDGGSVKIFLMPAGTGCVVIKKEVVQ